MRFDEYVRLDGLGLAEAVRRGEVTPAELAALARGAIAHDPLHLNAVIADLAPRARAQLAHGVAMGGPFPGVPFLIKDLVTPMAGVPATAGSRSCKDYVPVADAPIVARWEAAGLVLLGKTNTPEFGLLPVTAPVLFGPTRNPWRPTLNTGGSSGGSAAAVAAGWVPLAYGNDGGGSIRIPASLCGLFGFKPSVGRNAWENLEEIWNGAVTSSALTRSVRDAAAYLDWIAGSTPGYDAADPPAGSLLAASRRAPPRLRVALSLDAGALMPVSAEARAAALAMAERLRGLGHEVVEAAPAIDWLRLFRGFSAVVCAYTREDARRVATLTGVPLEQLDLELATRYLVASGLAIDARRRALADAAWAEARRAMADFHARYPVWLTPVAAFDCLNHDAYQLRPLEALFARVALALGIAPLLYRDALVDHAVRRELGRIPFTPIANITGAPSMSVPGYRTPDGLPVGALLGAAPGEDALLFSLAGELEAAAPWRDSYPFLQDHGND
ncbi:amidase [Niveibacterium sp. SC-1]|uniref:amidase n=1 Tax=Niveibacterium sp. SC-1 TaxID=3135646 RepID=UPI00311D752C